MSNFQHPTPSVSEPSPPAIEHVVLLDDLGSVSSDILVQSKLDHPFRQAAEASEDPANSGESSPEEFEEDSDKSSGSGYDDDSDTTWVPPEIHPVDMEYTIWKLLPWEEHDIYDELVVHLFETYKGPWPSAEDVFNNVQIASTILCLILVTASPDIPLKPEWTVTANVAVLAEQEILRKNLATAVSGKSFEILRSLGFWYEGY